MVDQRDDRQMNGWMEKIKMSDSAPTSDEGQWKLFFLCVYMFVVTQTGSISI